MCAACSGAGGDAVQSVLDAQQSSLRSQIDITVAAKQLEADKSQGAAIVQLIQSAATIGKASGQGGKFDAQG